MTMSNAIAAIALCAIGLNLHAGQVGVDPSPAAGSYRKVEVTDGDVQAAVKFALADQQRKDKGRSKLLSVISAERQSVSADNFRLCLSMDRSGRTELARVVLSRNARKRWSVTIWAWGACR